jgi:hypothetical protein
MIGKVGEAVVGKLEGLAELKISKHPNSLSA